MIHPVIKLSFSLFVSILPVSALTLEYHHLHFICGTFIISPLIRIQNMDIYQCLNLLY